MLGRAAHRGLSDLNSALPPTFLLPFRARLSANQAARLPHRSFHLTGSGAQSLRRRITATHTCASINAVARSLSTETSSDAASVGQEPTMSDQTAPKTPLPENTKQLLPLLKAQQPHYITIHIHAKPYLVTVGDVVRLPFLMNGVVPGDILRLTRASVLGSRDFTLKAGEPIKATGPLGAGTCFVDGKSVGLVPGAIKKLRYIDERLFVCRAVVLGSEAEPLRIMEKTKRRQRHVKTVKSKHRYTILKIRELTINGPEDIEGVE